MSVPERRPDDRRHPSWCQPARCEAGRDDILGDHRSRLMIVRAREPYDNEIRLWLIQPVHGPVTETPWLFMQIVDERVNGELDSLATYALRLDAGEDLGEALSRMVDLGRFGEPISEDEWRSGGVS